VLPCYSAERLAEQCCISGAPDDGTNCAARRLRVLGGFHGRFQPWKQVRQEFPRSSTTKATLIVIAGAKCSCTHCAAQWHSRPSPHTQPRRTTKKQLSALLSNTTTTVPPASCSLTQARMQSSLLCSGRPVGLRNSLATRPVCVRVPAAPSRLGCVRVSAVGAVAPPKKTEEVTTRQYRRTVRTQAMPPLGLPSRRWAHCVSGAC
jgi:hypothetical protein